MTMQTIGFAASDVDPFSSEFLRDPYPCHNALREAGPVVRLERYGIWAMARYAEVNQTLLDWETFCSSAGVGISDFRKEPPWRPPSLILEADPPLHTNTHRVLARVLSPAVLRSLRPAFERDADALVDTVLTMGEFDGIADVARAYPLKVFGDAVGLPADGRERLLAYGNMVFNAFGPRNALFEDAVAAVQPVLGWINAMCSREALAPGGIGAAVYAAVDLGEIAPEQAPVLVRSLLSAGLDTTVNAIGNALFCFAKYPAAWNEVRDDPSRARAAFDEAMRFESPVQTFFRTTTRAVDVSGVAIPEGEKVLMFLAAANRDPRRWESPDTFDVHRRTGGHVGFGAGIHRCVGEAIARLEGTALIAALARRVASIELAGEPVQRLNNTLRGFESLPLAVRAPKSAPA
jgi:cytochrome P450